MYKEVLFGVAKNQTSVYIFYKKLVKYAIQKFIKIIGPMKFIFKLTVTLTCLAPITWKM